MSYVDPTQNPDQDDNKSQVDKALQGNSQGQSGQSDQPSATPPPTSGGGGSGIVSGGSVGGASAPEAAGGPTKPSTSGSWTNLNDYLNANSDQATGIGSQIANSVNTQGQNAQNEIQNLSSSFNQGVNKGSVQEDSKGVSQAIANAQANKLSQNDLDTFQKQATASYSGPTDETSYSGYSQAQNDAQNAQTNAGMTRSEAGRDVLLQNTFNNASQNGYNAGENNLDQLLLEGSPGAQAQLSPLANQWSGLAAALANNVTADNANAASAKTATQNAATNATNAFNNARTTADQQVQAYLAQQQANYSTDYNALVAKLNGYTGGTLNLSPQQLQELGLTVGQRLYGLPSASPSLGSQYLTQAAFNPAAEITKEQQAELAALDQLGATAGITGTNQYTNAALAGTQTAANSIDSSGFQKALANAETAFNNIANRTLTATGGGSNPVYWQGGNQNGMLDGYINTNSSASQSLADYLAGRGPAANVGQSSNMQNISAGGQTYYPGSDSAQASYWSNLTAQLEAAAEAQAESNLAAQIQAELNSSGYNNIVGAPSAKPVAR